MGSKCSSSLAKCMTPPSHQHSVLCDPPSHGATRPAVLPGPGQWLQCPVYRPAPCFAAGMPSPVPCYDPAPPPFCSTTPAILTQINLPGGTGHDSSLRKNVLSEAHPIPISETFLRGHLVDQLVCIAGDSRLHNTTQRRALKGPHQ